MGWSYLPNVLMFSKDNSWHPNCSVSWGMTAAPSLISAPGRKRILMLLTVIAIEGVAGLFFWSRLGHHIILGFLVKQGNEYVVAWKDENGYESASYPSLNEAREFVHNHLGLSVASNPVPDHEVEHI